MLLLQPQEQFYVNISPTDNLTVEAFYQFDWDDTEPDPVGSWFSSNDFAVKGGNRDAFQQHFRSVDVLIVDDIHFFANKRATQSENNSNTLAATNNSSVANREIRDSPSSKGWGSRS